MRDKPEQWRLSLTYSKQEFLGSIVTIYFSTTSILFTMFGNLFYQFNLYRLPYTFYIIWLPINGTLLNWYLNYLHQATVLGFGASLFLMYFILTLLFMNHCCWGLDILILLVEDLGTVMESKVKIASSKKSIEKRFREIINMSHTVIQWRNDVQSLMKYSFLVEFSLMSGILCLCIYNVVSSPFESLFAPMTLSISISQLYIYCWMGNRVLVRIEKFISSLYAIKWYLIDVHQQKDLQMIMMMAQKMKGFNGIFKDVSMKTFQKVCYLKILNFWKLSNIFLHRHWNWLILSTQY